MLYKKPCPKQTGTTPRTHTVTGPGRSPLFTNANQHITPIPGFAYLYRPAPPHGPTALEQAIDDLRNQPAAPPRPKPHPRAVARAVGLWLAVMSRRRPPSVLSGEGFTPHVANRATALAATTPLPIAKELRSLRIHVLDDLTVRFTASVCFGNQVRALIGSMKPCPHTRRRHTRQRVVPAGTTQADTAQKRKQKTTATTPRWSVDAIDII